MIKKKLLTIALTAFIAVLFISCQNTNKANEQKTDNAVQDNTASDNNTVQEDGNTEDGNTKDNADTSDSNTKYIDGEYEGVAVGYSGGLKMKVTIKADKIEAIDCVSHNEVGQQYYEAAFRDVPSLIIERQSTEGIDAVSGSTMTTKGIIKAVNKALSKASK